MATSGGFTPTSITGLKVWLKADSLGLADGTSVSSWSDSSGSGNNVAQATSGNQPVYKTGIVNGNPIVRFDGVNDLLATSGSIAVSQPFTLFAVFKVPASAPAGNQAVVCGSNPYPGFFLNPTNGPLMYGGTSNVGSGTYDGAFHYFTGIFNAASSVFYRNGVSAGTGNPGTGGFGTFGVGSLADGSGQRYAGDVAETLLYNSSLSATDRGNVESYLATKYGL